MKIKLNDAAKKLKVAKGKIKDKIRDGEISYDIINGVYYVNIEEVEKKISDASSKSKFSKKYLKGKRVDFNYVNFHPFMIHGYFGGSQEIKDCNFALNDMMYEDWSNNEDVVKYLINKYKGKSEREMIQIVYKESYGFIDMKMPMTDYGFMVENINGEIILVFCGYFPLNHNKVEFFVGFTYDEFKEILNHRNPIVYRKNKTSSSKSPHTVCGHWRNQPYGSKNNPQYKSIWIEEFKKCVA